MTVVQANNPDILCSLAKFLNQSAKDRLLAFKWHKSKLFSIELESVTIWISLSGNSFAFLSSTFTSSFEKNISAIPGGLKLQEAIVFEGERILMLDFGHSAQIVLQLFGRNGNILIFTGAGAPAWTARKSFASDQVRSLDYYNALPRKTTCIDGSYKVISSQEIVGGQQIMDVQIQQDDSGRPAIEALEQFAKKIFKAEKINELKRELLTPRLLALKVLEKKVKSFQQQENQADKGDFEKKANVLMAHLHLQPEKGQVGPIEDFYTGKSFYQPLKPGETLAMLAEKLYAKSKQKHSETERLTKQKEETALKKHSLMEEINFLQAEFDLRQLRKFASNKPVSAESLPYKKFEYKGYIIHCGRNAIGNAYLLRNSLKNDVWLHAKDVSGSHVIIKVRGKENVPAEVVEWAASLALFYSKARRATVHAVAITQRKYVRQIKGAAPGRVTLERENSLIVSPLTVESAIAHEIVRKH